ncbi:reverse transcriptase domain-containing protein [Tanacetum coccineum]
MPPKKTTNPMTDVAIKQLIAQGVADALAEHEANKNSRNRDDSHDSGSGGRRHVPTTRECTYSDFLKCQPLNFKGTKGVIGLSQWFEKMKSVFHTSNCTVACQIKFATCTLLGSALTWWNSHIKTVGHDAAYGMPWKTLKKMMTTKYCPRSKIKKLEIEIWNLKIQRISLTGFPAQSVGSSNTDVLDSPCLLVLITGTSQSRQHVITSLIHIESCKSPTKSLFDVGSSRISIFTVNT